MQMMIPKGSVEVICGSMFSGKSEELIRRIRRAQYAKLKTIVLKPAVDNRSKSETIMSHDGNTIEAHSINDASEITTIVTKASDIDVVGIDEVQFFEQKVIGQIEQLARRGLRVIVAGLDTNFRGEPFGAVPELMALSDSVTKLNAICLECGQPASRTQRLIDQKPASYHDPLILIGAAESYEPRCRHCHVVLDKPKSTDEL